MADDQNKLCKNVVGSIQILDSAPMNVIDWKFEKGGVGYRAAKKRREMRVRVNVF